MLDKVRELENINSHEDMDEFVNKFRIIASNNRNNEKILSIVDRAIEKCEIINDQKSLVKCYEIKITQIQHSEENFTIIADLVKIMKEISKKIGYTGGIALAYNIEWYIEKYKGNKRKSKDALDESMRYIILNDTVEEYDYYVCSYSFAIEKWLVERDITAVGILEKCASYFMETGLYRSLTFTLGVLNLIYQQNQNHNKALNLSKKILGYPNLLDNIPEELQSIIHFFIGFSHELSFNLSKAEIHFKRSQDSMKPIHRRSTYLGYYITMLSHLVSTYALQGKLDLAFKLMKETDEMIVEDIIGRNLDSFSKRQIEHTFNLTKFYIKSRLQDFQAEELYELEQTILIDVGKYYSDAIFLSEFLLNTNLSKEQLLEIKNLNNPSTKRVEHIINFLIEKLIHTEEKQIMGIVSTLKRRPVEERMTLVERAYADLLAAQEYYRIGRFAEISPLLRKYEKQLNHIEVLELRIFMEAFIQIGAYKNGDPLGPALQYVAIKNCRYYGFSRLESKLLNYLDMQAKEAISM